MRSQRQRHPSSLPPLDVRSSAQCWWLPGVSELSSKLLLLLDDTDLHQCDGGWFGAGWYWCWSCWHPKAILGIDNTLDYIVCRVDSFNCDNNCDVTTSEVNFLSASPKKFCLVTLCYNLNEAHVEGTLLCVWSKSEQNLSYERKTERWYPNVGDIIPPWEKKDAKKDQIRCKKR